MVNRAERASNPASSRRQPARTPEAREQQLIAAAVDRAEKQLLDGTASAQVITHYLKLGSSRERLEQQRLAYENQLTEAKIEAMQSQKEIERLYGEALAAMSAYSGRDTSERSDD
jgi:hypothetical protein